MFGPLTQTGWVAAQMLITAALMYWATRQAMSASRRLLIWRCGFLLLAALPWLQPHMAVIQLPWLPVSQQATEQVIFMPQSEPVFAAQVKLAKHKL